MTADTPDSAANMISNSLLMCGFLCFVLAEPAAASSQDVQKNLEMIPGKRNSSRTRDLRCYCNLPACADNGWMCRTSKGHCYFELHDGQVALQGCSDRDSVEPNGFKCHAHTGRALRMLRRLPSSSPSRVCCDSQLCNHPAYVERLERQLGPRPGRDSRSETPPRSHPVVDRSSQEMWFRAAVIAVPIAGGCIMVVLVAVAVRLLRADSRLTTKQVAANEHLLPVRSSPGTQPFPTPLSSSSSPPPFASLTPSTQPLNWSHAEHYRLKYPPFSSVV